MYDWIGVAEWRQIVREPEGDNAAARAVAAPQIEQPPRGRIHSAARPTVNVNSVPASTDTTSVVKSSGPRTSPREQGHRVSRSLPALHPALHETLRGSEEGKTNTVQVLSTSIDNFLVWLKKEKEDPAPLLPDRFGDIVPALKIIKVKMVDLRAQTVANNRSLRTIKNELETLVENGVITDEQYDTILSTLPAEAPLRGGGANSIPTPARTASAQSTASPSLTNSFANMNVQSPAARNPSPAPLPPRSSPAPPPYKNEIGHAVALYDYPGADANDLTLTRGDHISVTEHMNAEWWSGTNVRTRQEGIFPANYVRTENGPSGLTNLDPNNEKAGGYRTQQQHNPYNNSAPPMALANDGHRDQGTPTEPGKGQQQAKKFGKKLGNAAIFGAGATIGGNIVNSIF